MMMSLLSPLGCRHYGSGWAFQAMACTVLCATSPTLTSISCEPHARSVTGSCSRLGGTDSVNLTMYSSRRASLRSAPLNTVLGSTRLASRSGGARRMKIDIDQLTEEELVDLNNRIV